MLRSLFSGISGLRTHQTMLDVTGNNIANVNTVGFKSSAVQFQDSLSQLVKNSTMPREDAGGSNPAQVGLGVQLAGIRTNFSSGAPQPTGVPTDLMIAGDGFFMVRNGGEAILVGVPRLDVMLNLNAAFTFLYLAKTVKGCWYGSSNVKEDVPKLIALYKEGKLKLEELVSREIGVDGVNEAFAAMQSGEVARSLITHTH